MRHVTMTCPECVTEDKAVGDPMESVHGWLGGWYCFACHAKGNYQITFETQQEGNSATHQPQREQGTTES